MVTLHCGQVVVKWAHTATAATIVTVVVIVAGPFLVHGFKIFQALLNGRAFSRRHIVGITGTRTDGGRSHWTERRMLRLGSRAVGQHRTATGAAERIAVRRGR